MQSRSLLGIWVPRETLNIESRLWKLDNRERSHDGLHVIDMDMVNSYGTISSHVGQRNG